jgi:hypothetical protein
LESSALTIVAVATAKASEAEAVSAKLKVLADARCRDSFGVAAVSVRMSDTT